MTKKKIQVILLLIISCAILAFTAYSVTAFFAVGGSGIMKVEGFDCFKFFTIDSNILMAVMSALLVFPCLMALHDGKLVLSEKLISCELIGTSAVTLTFIVVIAYLGPTAGYKEMFEGVNLLMHLVTPVLAIAALLLLEAVTEIPFKAVILSLLPAAAYGVIYFILMLTGVWEDFYYFNAGGLWPVFAIVVLAVQFAIAFALRLAHNKIMAACARKAASATEIRE